MKTLLLSLLLAASAIAQPALTLTHTQIATCPIMTWAGASCFFPGVGAEGTVLVYGGFQSVTNQLTSDQFSLYDVANDTWTAPAPLIQTNVPFAMAGIRSRAEMRITFDPLTATAYMFGGTESLANGKFPVLDSFKIFFDVNGLNVEKIADFSTATFAAGGFANLTALRDYDVTHIDQLGALFFLIGNEPASDDIVAYDSFGDVWTVFPDLIVEVDAAGNISPYPVSMPTTFATLNPGALGFVWSIVSGLDQNDIVMSDTYVFVLGTFAGGFGSSTGVFGDRPLTHVDPLGNLRTLTMGGILPNTAGMIQSPCPSAAYQTFGNVREMGPFGTLLSFPASITDGRRFRPMLTEIGENEFLVTGGATVTNSTACLSSPDVMIPSFTFTVQ